MTCPDVVLGEVMQGQAGVCVAVAAIVRDEVVPLANGAPGSDVDQCEPVVGEILEGPFVRGRSIGGIEIGDAKVAEYIEDAVVEALIELGFLVAEDSNIHVTPEEIAPFVGDADAEEEVLKL